MNTVIYSFISFAISILAFGYGAAKLFHKKKPLYFQILVCAAGCFAVSQLSNIVNVWCAVPDAFSVGLFGYFGCNFFLLSANLGTLDRIVDDGQSAGKARALGLVAPVVMALLIVTAFMAWKERDIYRAIAWVIMLMPALPASFFNLKHILLPLDPYEFLKATRSCNLIALLFYILISMYSVVSSTGNEMLSGILLVLISVQMLSLTLSAERGEKLWAISA